MEVERINYRKASDRSFSSAATALLHSGGQQQALPVGLADGVTKVEQALPVLSTAQRLDQVQDVLLVSGAFSF